jgi:adenylylsulfate kinase
MFSETEKKKNIKHAIEKSSSKQVAKVVWMTGFSGSGKTTIAENLSKMLLGDGLTIKIFDGDELRKGLCKDLGYNDVDRKENIRRAAEVAKLFVDSGIIVICCFISPAKEMRDMAKSIIGENKFIEVYINCPFDVCEKRDVKGFYAKARNGEVKNFTGIDSVYEIPVNPDIVINTFDKAVEESVVELYNFVLPLLK